MSFAHGRWQNLDRTASVHSQQLYPLVLLSFSELQGLIQSSPIQVLLTPFSHWAIINSVYSAQVDQATGPQGS